MSSKITHWEFMIGKWQSLPETHVGDPEGSSNQAEFRHFPSDQFLQFNNSTFVGDNLITSGMSVLFFDIAESKFRMKSFFGYGFVVSYIEQSSDDNTIVFVSERVESSPPDYAGVRLRYTVKKISDARVEFLLEMSQNGDYFTFWQAQYSKTD